MKLFVTKYLCSGSEPNFVVSDDGGMFVISGCVVMVSIVQTAVVDFFLKFCHFNHVHFMICKATERSACIKM